MRGMALQIQASRSESLVQEDAMPHCRLTLSRRHLVRLWLRDPEYAWETPEPLKARFEQLYGNQNPDNQVFPLEPYIRGESNGASANK